MPEKPSSYVENNGASTSKAEKIGACYDVNETQGSDYCQALRTELREVAKALPDRNTLNFASKEAPYVVKSTDTGGILKLLKAKMPAAQLEKPEMIKLAYGNMSRAAAETKKVLKVDAMKIDLLNAGDKVYVENGRVNVIRGNGEGSYAIPLYPYDLPKSAEPMDPAIKQAFESLRNGFNPTANMFLAEIRKKDPVKAQALQIEWVKARNSYVTSQLNEVWAKINVAFADASRPE